MTEAMGLKLLHRGPLKWHYLHTKFHEILPSGSKVISRGLTDWRFEKPTIIFESRLKITNPTGLSNK
jgi:hypothetical protein